MHPAPSIILFTTVSGLGFGVLGFLCLGFPAVAGLEAFLWFAAGYALAGGGLSLSLFHLGQPGRALKAFTQWRSSWLSREAVAATFTMSVVGIQALLMIFADGNSILGIVAAVMCLATVCTTAMIYTQLKTVPRWNHPLTPVQFLLFALAGGALVVGENQVALVALAILTVVQAAAWLVGDQRMATSGSSIESATQLGGPGVRSVRLLEPPHTGGNYLTREMVFIVARRRSRQIRILAIASIGIVPLVLLALPIDGAWVRPVCLVMHAGGAIMSRWLFFAEAEHVVGLYYGRQAPVAG